MVKLQHPHSNSKNINSRPRRSLVPPQVTQRKQMRKKKSWVRFLRMPLAKEKVPRQLQQTTIPPLIRIGFKEYKSFATLIEK